jgi:hypothetical protein
MSWRLGVLAVRLALSNRQDAKARRRQEMTSDNSISMILNNFY